MSHTKDGTIKPLHMYVTIHIIKFSRVIEQ